MSAPARLVAFAAGLAAVFALAALLGAATDARPPGGGSKRGHAADERYGTAGGARAAVLRFTAGDGAHGHARPREDRGGPATIPLVRRSPNRGRDRLYLRLPHADPQVRR